MGFPLKGPLPGQFDWILQDIRNGLVLPDLWPEDLEEEEEGEEDGYVRWWEQDDNSLTDLPIERASRTRRQG